MTKKKKNAYLAFWFFMKSGPCLRKSVVSPKTGQPIVPGGKPLLWYLISFHFNRAKQAPSNKDTPRTTIKTAIDALSGTDQVLCWSEHHLVV